ncbi:hypothetical protein C8R43DRAFT_1018316 [Mycena crocata]|nr:hypothetical protein C8R43DRAFT_1018316 [Mycena crocata]
MSPVGETSFSLFTSILAPITSTKIMLATVLLILAIYYASPARLTRTLVAAIGEVEIACITTLEAGIISTSDVEMAEQLFALRIRVSNIHETTLRNSLSHVAALSAFLRGYALTVLQCISEVRELQTRIDILKETRLRDSSSALRALSLRWRPCKHINHPASMKSCGCLV